MLINDIAGKYQDYVIRMRRKFHRCPEVALKETKTCRMICEELEHRRHGGHRGPVPQRTDRVYPGGY